MAKIVNCPSCKEVLEMITEDQFFCKACDLTVKFTQGKAKIEAKGRIQEIEENLAILQRDYGLLKKELIGSEDLIDL